MSEVTENPGKQKGMVGMILAIAGLIFTFLMGWLYLMGGKIVALLPLVITVVGLIMSIQGMQASKKAGQSNGMAVAGLVIAIVGILWGIFAYMGVLALDSMGGHFIDAARSGDLNDLNDMLDGLQDLSH